MNESCTYPSITVYFQNLGFGGFENGTFLNVYYQNKLLSSCGSNNNANICGDYQYCLQEYILEDSANIGDQIVVHLEKSRDSIDCGNYYTLFADITLRCALTMNPTVSPTNDPTIEPTTQPTVEPTYTNSPTTNPTLSPSYNPTTQDPTNYPTVSPSNNPTVSPTRLPTTINVYDSYIDIVYGLDDININGIEYISNNLENVMIDMQIIVESGYVNHQSLIDGWNLDYQHFWLQFDRINGHTLTELFGDPARAYLIIYDALEQDKILIDSNIKCESFWCDYIIRTYDEDKLEKVVTHSLNDYFNDFLLANDSMTIFTVEDMTKETKSLYSEIGDPSYVFFIISCMTGIIMIFGIFGFIFNKIPDKMSKFCGFSIVDDGKWISVMIYGLTFWDFASDINLAAEIWFEENVLEKDGAFKDYVILTVSIGTILFVIVPYIINLIIAIRIKHFIKDNDTAKSW